MTMGLRHILALAAVIATAGATGAPALQQTPVMDSSQIEALDLPGIVVAIQADCAAMRTAMQELTRRYPDEHQDGASCGTSPAAPTPDADLQSLSDDALFAEIEARSTELSQLVAHGEALQEAGATIDPATATRLGVGSPAPADQASVNQPADPTTQVEPPAPAPTAEPASPPSAKRVSAATKGYCKAMYAKAYSLCGTLGDRSCKFSAADHWSICEATGRWP